MLRTVQTTRSGGLQRRAPLLAAATSLGAARTTAAQMTAQFPVQFDFLNPGRAQPGHGQRVQRSGG